MGNWTPTGVEPKDYYEDKHIGTKKDSEVTDFPNSFAWLGDMDNDKENVKRSMYVRCEYGRRCKEYHG